MLSEGSQTERQMQCIFTYMWNLKHNTNKHNRNRLTENKLVVTRDESECKGLTR